VNIYSNVVHESSSSFLALAYAEQLLSSYLTPILPSQTFSLAQDWHGISRKSLPGIACAYALAIAIRVSYDSSTAEASRYRHGIFSRIEPGRKPCGSRSTCHCHVDLSNRSAVEKVAPKVAFAKRKQLAQKTVGSRDNRTSRVCSGPVGGVAQGCNIRSPVAQA